MSILLASGSAPPAETVTVDKYWIDSPIPQAKRFFISQLHTDDSTDPIAAPSYTPTIDKFWTDSQVPYKPEGWNPAYFKHSYRADYVPAPPTVINIGWMVFQALPQQRVVEVRDLSVFVPDLTVECVADFIQQQVTITQGRSVWRDMSVEPILVDAEAIIVRGGGFSHKRPQICVITVDGQDYRVRLENISAFLEAYKKKAITPDKVVKAKKAKGKNVKSQVRQQPEKIVIKSVPPEYRSQIQASVDRTNEILRKIWEGNLTRLVNEAEEEEALAIVMMMEF